MPSLHHRWNAFPFISHACDFKRGINTYPARLLSIQKQWVGIKNGIRIHIYIYTYTYICLLFLISMLWHIYILTHIHIHARTFMRSCVRAYIRVRTYIHIWIMKARQTDKEWGCCIYTNIIYIWYTNIKVVWFPDCIEIAIFAGSGTSIVTLYCSLWPCASRLMTFTVDLLVSCVYTKCVSIDDSNTYSSGCYRDAQTAKANTVPWCNCVEYVYVQWTWWSVIHETLPFYTYHVVHGYFVFVAILMHLKIGNSVYHEIGIELGYSSVDSRTHWCMIL